MTASPKEEKSSKALDQDWTHCGIAFDGASRLSCGGQVYK